MYEFDLGDIRCGWKLHIEHQLNRPYSFHVYIVVANFMNHHFNLHTKCVCLCVFSVAVVSFVCLFPFDTIAFQQISISPRQFPCGHKRERHENLLFREPFLCVITACSSVEHEQKNENRILNGNLDADRESHSFRHFYVIEHVRSGDRFLIQLRWLSGAANGGGPVCARPSREQWQQTTIMIFVVSDHFMH